MNKPTDPADMLRENEFARMRRDVAIIKRQKLEPCFADDKAIEGRALNREAHIDGKREADAMDRNCEP